MTLDEFSKSLNAEQSAALLAFRQQINDLRDKAHQELVTSKADEIAQLKADVATATKSASDAATAAAAELVKVKFDAEKDKRAVLDAKDAEISKLQSSLQTQSDDFKAQVQKLEGDLATAKNDFTSYKTATEAALAQAGSIILKPTLDPGDHANLTAMVKELSKTADQKALDQAQADFEAAQAKLDAAKSKLN